MQEKDIVFLDGEFLHKNEAKISDFDSVFTFADLVEVAPVMFGVLVYKNEFFARLKRSLEAEFVDFVFNEDELEENLQKLIEKNSLKEGFLYFKVSKGVSSKDFDLVEWFEPIIMAYVYEDKIENNPLVKSGVTIILLPEIQWKKIYKKSGSFAARCYAQKMITKAKAYDGFFVENDYIAYSLNSSLFIIKDKNLIAKPLPNDKILSFASELGLKIDERAFSMQDIYNADEVFISAASLPILPVVKVDERLINFGEVGEFSKKLMQRYIQNMQDEARKSKYFAL